MRALSSTRLSGAAIAVAAAMASNIGAPARATTYFDATAPGVTFKATDLLFTGFTFGYYDVRFAGQCENCVIATTPAGASLGTFGFSMNGLPWSYLEDPSEYPGTTTQSAIPGFGGYYERFEGYGFVDYTTFNGAPPNLLTSDFDAVDVYATPGKNGAVVQFELDGTAKSDLVRLPSTRPLYLIITASTDGPVELVNLTSGPKPLQTFQTPLTFDYSAVLTDTPYSGPAVPVGVPEPSVWAMLLAGMAAMGGLLRSRRSAGAASVLA